MSFKDTVISEDDATKRFVARLVEFRESEKMSIYDVAALMGYPPAHVSTIERGTATMWEIARYAAAIGVHLELDFSVKPR